jgi:hypothetical protein
MFSDSGDQGYIHDYYNRGQTDDHDKVLFRFPDRAARFFILQHT